MLEFQHRRLDLASTGFGMSSGVEQLVDFHQGLLKKPESGHISTQVSLLATSRYQLYSRNLASVVTIKRALYLVAVGNGYTASRPPP